MLSWCTGKRKALQVQQAGVTNKKWVVYTDRSDISKSTSLIQQPSHQSTQAVAKIPQDPVKGFKAFCDIPLEQREAMLRALYVRASQNPTLTPNPSFGHTQYNVFTAMFTNARLLGLTLDLLNEDLASQFNLVGPSSLHLPPSLWPSKSQRKIIHHPWIDLIPMLSLRDSLLARMEILDEDELCGDLYGASLSPAESGLRVWGEAWDPFAYEASEALIRKWSWMVKECPDIIESTNYWRRRRGAKALVLKQS